MNTQFKNAQWIVPKEFENLKTVNIYHNETLKVDIPLPINLRNLHITYRKEFSLSEFKNVQINITADDYYKLYINGKFVGQGPAQSYFWNYYWNSYDITSFMKEGKNSIEVQVYYCGMLNRSYTSADRRIGMIADLTVDGKETVATDADWDCAISKAYEITHTIGYDTAFAENFDSRIKDVFEKAVIKNTDYIFAENPVKSVVAYEQKYVCCQKLKDGGMFYDFGQLLTGTLKITAKGKSGDKIRILLAEELEDTPLKIRYDMRCNCKCEEFWTLADGQCTFTGYDYKGFRYAVLIPENDAQILDMCAVVRHYPFDDNYCDLVTDRARLKQIWNICKNAVKYGSQEIYVDCPTREKAQYSGDMTITSASQIILTGDTTLLKKAIDDQMESAKISKGLLAVTPGSLMQGIADYSLQFPIWALRYYSYSGDKEYLCKNLEICKGMLEHFSQFKREDGLLSSVTDKWNLVDWPENLRDGYDFPLTRPMTADSGTHNVINAFYVGCVMGYEQMCEILNVPYEKCSEALILAFNREFYCEKTGLYTDAHNTEHSAIQSNIVPLFYGISKDKDEQKIADFIVNKGLCCGVYMAYFLLKGICRVGRYDDALSIIENESEHSWYNMVREGGTTCFEAWGKEQKWNTSLCHPWASAPISVLVQDIIPNMSEVGKIIINKKDFK